MTDLFQNVLHPLQPPSEEGASVIPILQMGKRRQGTIKSLVQNLIGWDLNLRGLAPAPVFLMLP